MVPFRKVLSYIISVSMGTGCYRHVQIESTSTLEQLHEAILSEFGFDDDHLHAFFMSNRVWDCEDCYYSKHADEGHFTNDVTLISAGLAADKKFLYLFDFGDEWRFSCRVLRQIEASTPAPICVRSKGDPPEQYGADDEWDDDTEESEDEFAEYIEQMQRAWRQIAIKTVKPAESLREMLACRDKMELVQILESLGAQKIYRWGVDKLIEGIAGYLVKPEVLRDRLYALDEIAWDLFLRAATQPMLELQELEVNLCMLPHILGLLQPYRYGEQYLCVVPQEIRTVFSQLLAEGIKEDHDRHQLLDTYALAMVNLYGIIPIAEFIQIFNDQNPAQQTNHQEALSVLEQPVMARRAPYCLWEDYLVHEALWVDDFAAAEDCLADTEDKPRYIPTRDELLLYADMDYYEITPQIKAVGNYFALRHGVHPDMIAELLELLHMLAFFNHQPNEMMELLANRGIVLDIKRLNEFLRLTTEVFNNTRIWLNKGHTPAEMVQLTSGTLSPPLRLAVKVGRNDPCPCGSGKKYKLCCGR